MTQEKIQTLLTKHVPGREITRVPVPGSFGYVAAESIKTPVELSIFNLRPNDIVIPKGTLLNASSVALLSEIGLREIGVYDKPKVALMSVKFKGGDDSEKNSSHAWNFSLVKAFLDEMQVRPIFIRQLKNQRDILKTAIRHTFRYANIILLTQVDPQVGRLRNFLEEEGVETLFVDESGSPSKLAYLGKKDHVLVLILPLTLEDVFQSFYRYVRPVIRLMMGYSSVFLEKYPSQYTLFVKPENTSSHLAEL